MYTIYYVHLHKLLKKEVVVTLLVSVLSHTNTVDLLRRL